MAASPDQDLTPIDPFELPMRVAEIFGSSQRIATEFWRNQLDFNTLEIEDNLGLGDVVLRTSQQMLAQPALLMERQSELLSNYMRLWQNSALSVLGQNGEPVASPERGDRRFRHDDWNENAYFDMVKQFYLLTSQWTMDTLQEVDGLDERARKKLEFYTRQMLDALSPTNFPLTNPEVLRTALESGGRNFLSGFSNLLQDLERGQGKLRIRMTDLEAFELGVNVATTPGKVVYQNELMQLLQYSPTTETVYQRPLLIVPPWINKFYILDLRAKNSFIKWWVDQGFTVFLISWINPDESLAQKNFEHYMLEGPLAAIDAIEQATGEREVNAVGYCLGGTLLASTAAWMATKGDDRLKSCTFMTTMLDFSSPGDLEVFIDEQQLDALDRRMQQRGYLDGAEMATTFNLLRANDLVWSFFINNYLLGKEPFPFDLLYWNSDSTRMPARMHSFYLRNMYLENRLAQPGGIQLAGESIELSKVTVPAYFASTYEDHIAPWKSTYKGTQLLSGSKRFVLGGSGHIAGAINPPVANKYGYWVNENLVPDCNDWFEAASQREGSWWLDWLEWAAPLSGEQVAARQPGSGQLPALEDAPGRYVKQRAA